MTPDFSPFRHLKDVEAEEAAGIFVDAKTGDPILIRAQQDYWMNPFALRFVPARDLKKEGYQDYIELFEPEEKGSPKGEREAGAPGY